MKKILLCFLLVFASLSLFSQNNIKKVGEVSLSRPHSPVGTSSRVDVLTDENKTIYFAFSENKLSLTEKDVSDLVKLLGTCSDLFSKNSTANYGRYIGMVNSTSDLNVGFISLTYLNKEMIKEVAITFMANVNIYTFVLDDKTIKELVKMFEDSKVMSEKILFEINKIK